MMITGVAALAERVGWTFVAAAIAALPVTLALTSHGARIAGYVALTAGVTAVVALAKNLVLKVPVFSVNPIWNVVERFAWTAVQTFVGSLPATITLTGHSLAAIGYSGLTATVAALVSFAKNLTVTTPAVVVAP